MTNPRNCTTCRHLGPNDHPSRPECRDCGGAAEGWKNHQPRMISADPPCATCRHVQVFLEPLAPGAIRPEPCGSCRAPLLDRREWEWRNHQLGDIAFPKWRIMEADMLTEAYRGTEPGADPTPEAQQEAARRLFDRLAKNAAAAGPAYWIRSPGCDHGLLEATSDGRRCKACGASWSYSVAHDAELLNATGTPQVPRVIETPASTLVDPAAINELEWLCSPVGEFVDDAQRLAALISAGQRSVVEHRRRVNELLEANEAEVNRRRDAERELERRIVAFEALLDTQIDTSKELAPLARLEKLVVQFLSADALLGMMDTDETKAAAQAQLEQTKAALHEFFGTRPREDRGHA